MPENQKYYVFTDKVPLSQGYSFNRFYNIVSKNLKEKLLNDNTFILKDSENRDYIKDIIFQQLERLDMKEEEFLQQLATNYKLIVDNASTYVKAEFSISPKTNNIYSSFYKESFILTPNFEAPENDLLVNEMNEYINKQSSMFPGIELNLHRNQQTRQAKLAITYRINSVHTKFPVSQFF